MDYDYYRLRYFFFGLLLRPVWNQSVERTSPRTGAEYSDAQCFIAIIIINSKRAVTIALLCWRRNSPYLPRETDVNHVQPFRRDENKSKMMPNETNGNEQLNTAKKYHWKRVH